MGIRARRFILLVVALAFLGAAGALVQPLRGMQARYDLTSSPVKGVKPGVVLATTALGAFRGIIVDIVWIRMENLKGEGEFFEIVQLADLACRLAPRLSAVWDFNSWNMAYNISVELDDRNERWPWVKQGIEVLRDRGIPSNPRDPKLYFSLAWIYMHKIGDDVDDAHFLYKFALAQEMHEALGGSGSIEDLRWIDAAPETERELLADDEIRQFYETCLAHGFDPLDEGLEGDIPAFFVYVRNRQSIPADAREIMEAERNRDALAQIAQYVHARRLKELRLNPKTMIELVEQYGPFDWRGPYPHAIYWATEGRKVAQSYRERVNVRRETYGIEAPEDPEWDQVAIEFHYPDIEYDRVIYGALKKLVTYGLFVFDREGRMLPIRGPDYRFIPTMIDTYERFLEVYGESERFAEGVKGAYESFLAKIILQFYLRGQDEQARKYHGLLLERFGPKRDPYDQFVHKELMGMVDRMGPNECSDVVRALLFQAYEHLGQGGTERFTEYTELASSIIDEYNMKQGDLYERSRGREFDRLDESVLMDIFAGRSPLSPEAIEGLKEALTEARGADAVAELEAAVKAQQEATPRPLNLRKPLPTETEQD